MNETDPYTEVQLLWRRGKFSNFKLLYPYDPMCFVSLLWKENESLRDDEPSNKRKVEGQVKNE